MRSKTEGRTSKLNANRKQPYRFVRFDEFIEFVLVLQHQTWHFAVGGGDGACGPHAPVNRSVSAYKNGSPNEKRKNNQIIHKGES